MFTITAPNAASVWVSGSPVTITWTGGSTSTLVNLSLVDVSAWAVYTTIATAIPNSGAFTWTVPANVPAGTYLIYIENVERTVWAYGENFPIESGKGKPDLAIVKKPEGPLQAGQTGAYMVMVTNVGTGPASGPIAVTDNLGAGLTFVSASGTGWTCSNSGPTVTCTHPGPLPASSSLPAIVITVAVARDAQKVENCASVAMEGQRDGNPDNDKTCIGTPTEPPVTGAICGVKFEDRNGDGVRDPGEPGLAGWTIQMLDSAGNVVSTTVTGSGGRFCFKEVRPGTYTFGEVMQQNWTQTYPAAPGTYTVSVSPGENQQLLVFGNRPGKDPCCLTFQFPAGKADGFVTTDGLEAAAPSPALVASLPGTLSAIFDGTVVDRFFAHTFTLPQGNCIESARLEFKARPLGSGSTVANDSLALRFTGVTGSPSWGSYFGSGNANPGLEPNPWKLPNYGSGQLFTLDLSNLPGGGNLIATLNSQRFLDMYVQDDTAIDYLLLTVAFCECTREENRHE